MDREMCSKAAETGSKLDKEFFNARTGRSPIGEPKRCQLSTADRWPQRSQNEALQCHSFFSGSSTVVLCAHIYIYIFEKSASSFELSRISPSSSCRLHSPQCSKRTKTAVAWCNRLCGLLLAHLLIYTCRGAQVCVRDSCLRVTFTIILSNARYYVDQACHKTV